MASFNYTLEQKKAITHGPGTMLVAAGAGSGKTFMLTQRIAYLFDKESGKDFGCPGQAAITDIDQICAITFTEKAAQELKDRIRSKLFEIGQVEQALKVDSAWISTIHGMCSRVLKSYAVDVGINPNFNIVMNEEEQGLLQEAFEQAIDKYRYGNIDKNPAEYRNKHFMELINEYSLYGSFSSDGVKEMVFNLVSLANKHTNGFKGINKLTISEEIIAQGIKTFCDASNDMLSILSSANDSDRKNEAMINLKNNVDLCVYHSEKQDIMNYTDAAKLMEQLYCPPANLGSADIRTKIKEYQSLFIYFSKCVKNGYSNKYWDSLLELAIITKKIYQSIKFQKGCLDNDDLLTKTLSALNSCSIIKNAFKRKFKIVMVDEFQDTSNLQISVINKLLGENSSLNVVGDAQQSIYRFQGADVTVFNDFKNNITHNPDNGFFATMTKNFRSSQNVLKFVEKIFSNRQMFGNDFLKLSWIDDAHKPKTKDSGISFILASKEGKAKTSDIINEKAIEIASRFKSLLDAGYQAKDMVLLLGKMSNASIYASALREKGFDCVVASGSNLNRTQEIENIICVIQYFMNRDDTYALFNVLHGPMFNLSIDQIASFFLKNKMNKDLLVALSLIDEAASMARHESIYLSLRHLFVRSGWSVRLETHGASGYATSANVLKATRIIKEIEDESTEGFFTNCCKCIDCFGQYSKHSPGTLNIGESNAVKIMTIHGSKGLEFPVVAVSDFDSPKNNNRLLLETIDSLSLASLGAGSLFAAKFPNTNKFANKKINSNDETFTQKDSIISNRDQLKDYINEHDSAEDMRKLYVGLTRAKKVLILAAECSVNSKGDVKYNSDTNEGIVKALLGCQFNPQNCDLDAIDFGGTKKADLKILHVNPQENTNLTNTLKTENFLSIQTKPFPKFSVFPSFEKFDDLVSYSSLNDGIDVSYVASWHVEEIEERVFEAPSADKDHATELGSAFHELAQFEVETGIIPDGKLISKAALNYQLSENQRERLNTAITNWFGSKIYADTKLYSSRMAEVPFCIPYDDSRFLHGAVDLLCIDGKSVFGNDVVIYDYKTGGNPAESNQVLYKKHVMQAQCYAEALKYAGAKSIKVIFVRVEQNCQTVTFEY